MLAAANHVLRAHRSPPPAPAPPPGPAPPPRVGSAFRPALAGASLPTFEVDHQRRPSAGVSRWSAVSARRVGAMHDDDEDGHSWPPSGPAPHFSPSMNSPSIPPWDASLAEKTGGLRPTTSYLMRQAALHPALDAEDTGVPPHPTPTLRASPTHCSAMPPPT